MKTYKNDTPDTQTLQWCVAPLHGSEEHTHQWLILDVPAGSRVTYDDGEENKNQVELSCEQAGLTNVTEGQA